MVAARGGLMGALPEGGAMVSLAASESEVSSSLEGFEGRVSVAAVNGPASVVISGDEDAVLELACLWGERGVKTKRLRVSHAFHSPRMDDMLREFGEVLSGLSFSEPSIPIVSNLSGSLAGSEIASVEYWVSHARETVRFMDGVRWLASRGVRSFLEIGPDGVLSGMGQECLVDQQVDQQIDSDGASENARDSNIHADADASGGCVFVPVLRGGRPEVSSLFLGLGEVWVGGVGC